MNMTLHFSSDLVDGDGTDEIGKFQVHGQHDSKEVSWTKIYTGRQHTVRYRGFRDGLKKALWGTWRISPNITGGFRIWPVGSSDDIEETKSEKKPTEAIGNLVAVEAGNNAPTQTEMPSPNQQYAERLIQEDRILDGAKALCCSYHLSPSIRPKPTCVILSYLFENCSFEQRREASYLMDEFAVPLPPAAEAKLRIKEHAMYTKFHDTDGLAKTIRRLAMLDDCDC